MPNISLSSIDNITRASLYKVGVDHNSIDIVLDTIHYANRRGVPTHGVGRLPLYIKKILAGSFNPKDECEVIKDFGAMAILDAHNGFGQVAANKAVNIAIAKAKKYGVAAVGVRNSNNFATAGYFGDMAAKNGMVAMIYANASPAMAPTGGSKAILGTNPICYAFPSCSNDVDPIVLDMATTQVARGKVRLAAKNGEVIPLGWAIDSNGQATSDPNEALKGSLLPVGGYKGYGLSLFVDLFAGLLTDSACSGEVQPLSDLKAPSRNGHLFILIDAASFLEKEKLSQEILKFKAAVKACGEPGKVMLPGERGYKEMQKHFDMVTISEKQIEEINAAAHEVGVMEMLEAL